VAADDYPVGNDEGLEQAPRDERRGDNTHAFLRVVGAVAETIASGRDELKAAEPLIHFQWALPANDPTRDNRDGHARSMPNQRREKNKGEQA